MATMNAESAINQLKKEYRHVDYSTKCRLINMIYSVYESGMKAGAAKGLPKTAKCMTATMPTVTIRKDENCPL